MATWHLEELEKQLHRIGWRIDQRIAGDDHAIVTSWIICRKMERQLDFTGMDLMGKLLEHPYACQISNTQIDLYFYRKGKMWDNALHEFISQLNQLD